VTLGSVEPQPTIENAKELIDFDERRGISVDVATGGNNFDFDLKSN
jgi:hypothetical protein